MKKFKWIALGLLAVIVIAVVVVFLNLNSIIRKAVEVQGTASLNAKTTLQGASLSLFGGNVALNDFAVGSPEGYKAPQMLSLGKLQVDTSWSELRQDPIRVASIDVESPRLVLEMSGMTMNIKKFIEGLPKGDTSAPTEQGEPMKLVIGKLNVRGAQVVFRPDLTALASLPGDLSSKVKPEYTLTIPDLSIENIGNANNNQNGAAIKEVVTQIVTTLAGKAAESPELPPELRSILSGDLSSITGLLKEKGMAQVQQQLDKVTGELKEKLGSDVTGKLNDLLDKPAGKDDKANPVGNLLEGLGKKQPTTKP
jgi:hypothetical protein